MRLAGGALGSVCLGFPPRLTLRAHHRSAHLSSSSDMFVSVFWLLFSFLVNLLLEELRRRVTGRECTTGTFDESFQE